MRLDLSALRGKSESLERETHMPIYEYICSECGEITELLQKMGAAAPSECKICGSFDTMKKKVSQTSFQLKGGGWYSDLYGSTPQGGGSKTDISPKSESKPAETTKTEKAPDKKSESVSKKD